MTTVEAGAAIIFTGEPEGIKLTLTDRVECLRVLKSGSVMVVSKKREGFSHRFVSDNGRISMTNELNGKRYTLYMSPTLLREARSSQIPVYKHRLIHNGRKAR